MTAAVVSVLRADPATALPDRVRVCSGAAVDAGDAVVLDLPWWAPLLEPDEVVPGGAEPDRVAEALDLGVASAQLPAELVEPADATPAPVAADVVDRIDRVATTLGLTQAAAALTVRPGLAVRAGDRDVTVSWWCVAGHLFSDGSAAGVGRALSWWAGRWADRYLAVAAAAGDVAALIEASTGSARTPGV